MQALARAPDHGPGCWEAARTPEEVYACLVRAAVPALADWAEVFAMRGRALALVAWGHADPRKTPLIPERRVREALDPGMPGLRPVLLGEGEEVVPHLPPSLLPALSPDAEHLRLTRALGMGSYLTVPVGRRGFVTALLRLVRDGPAGYGEGGLNEARVLAERAAHTLAHLAGGGGPPPDVEARYRALVHDSPQAVEVWSRDGRLLEVNAAWERLLGLHAEDLHRFNLFEDAQMRAARLVELFERSFLGERVVFPVVVFDPRGLRPQATPRWLRTLPLPVRGRAGRVQELIVVHEPATEAEQLEAARRLEGLGVALPRDLDPRGAAGRGPLSPREREVLRLVAEGCSNKEIARALGVAERTAKFHVTSILNKLGADTRARAAALAARQGLV